MARTNQIDFYRRRLEAHGPGAEGVGWDSPRTQRLRFGVLLSGLGDLRERSLADAGCGTGELWLYLRERGQLSREYLGLELSGEMAALARERTGERILRRDILRDRLPAADWYIASGSMNLLSPLEVRLFIRRCWEACRIGFAFNLLEGRERPGPYGYHSVREIREYCRSLGAEVTIVNDYLEGDFTVIMRSGR
jgi:SAM-dependent methyltransferase